MHHASQAISDNINQLMSSQIPLFVHVPRAAGTYVQALISKCIFANVNPDKRSTAIRLRVTTTTGGRYTLWCMFQTGTYEHDKRLKRSFVGIRHKVNDSRVYTTPLNRDVNTRTLIWYIVNRLVTPLAVMIEPLQAKPCIDLRPVFLEVQNLMKLANVTTSNYIASRECFDRAQSMFTYIKAPESTHETTHGQLDNQQDLIEYIKSPMLEDSWLIRTFTGVPDHCKLTLDWMYMAVDFFKSNKFVVYDATQSTDIVRYSLSTCHGFLHRDNLPGWALDTSQLNFNKTNSDKIDFDTLPKHVRDMFTSRTVYDQQLRHQLLSELNISTRIPRIIHQTWIHDLDISTDWIDKNPGIHYRFYNDRDMLMYIERNFSRRVLECYNRLVNGSAKADLFRYCVMYVDGGLYIDMDCEPTTSVINLFRVEDDMILVRNLHGATAEQQLLFNGVIGSRPGLQLFRRCIDTICDSIEQNLHNVDPPSDIHNLTGCMMLKQHVDKYRRGLNINELMMKLVDNAPEISYNGQVNIRPGQQPLDRTTTPHYGDMNFIYT